MDEPFSSLDVSLKRTLIALTAELWRETGSTVLFVTHDIHEAAVLSGRALVLQSGAIVADVENPAPYPRDFLTPLPIERKLLGALLHD